MIFRMIAWLKVRLRLLWIHKDDQYVGVRGEWKDHRGDR